MGPSTSLRARGARSKDGPSRWAGTCAPLGCFWSCCGACAQCRRALFSTPPPHARSTRILTHSFADHRERTLQNLQRAFSGYSPPAPITSVPGDSRRSHRCPLRLILLPRSTDGFHASKRYGRLERNHPPLDRVPRTPVSFVGQLRPTAPTSYGALLRAEVPGAATGTSDSPSLVGSSGAARRANTPGAHRYSLRHMTRGGTTSLTRSLSIDPKLVHIR
jgi:hypothetical protein